MDQLAAQPSLFSTGVASLDESFVGATRTQLDETSWVEVVPGWLRGSDALLDLLVDAVAWKQRTRWMYDRIVDEPRLTAEYTAVDEAPHSILRAAAAALSSQYGVPYDGLWLNLYRDERDSTSWHGDRFWCRRSECIVPVLTLGAQRRFLLKPRRGGPSIRFAPAAGDLLVMGGRCQRDWQHCVPKVARACGLRVSINFQSRLQATPDGS